MIPTAVKVGMTGDRSIQNRLKALQTGNPRKLFLETAIGFPTIELAQTAERLIHNKLREWRVEGEWFQANDDVLHFIDFGLEFYGDYVMDVADMAVKNWEAAKATSALCDRIDKIFNGVKS